jgi:hypothetical protein
MTIGGAEMHGAVEGGLISREPACVLRGFYLAPRHWPGNRECLGDDKLGPTAIAKSASPLGSPRLCSAQPSVRAREVAIGAARAFQRHVSNSGDATQSGSVRQLPPRLSSGRSNPTPDQREVSSYLCWNFVCPLSVCCLEQIEGASRALRCEAGNGPRRRGRCCGMHGATAERPDGDGASLAGKELRRLSAGRW